MGSKICPECGKPVWEYNAECCNCGYIFFEKKDPQLFDAIFEGFMTSASAINKIEAANQFGQLTGYNINTAINALDSPPCTVKTGLKAWEIEWVRKTFLEYGAIISSKPSSENEYRGKDLEDMTNVGNKGIVCPKCGSKTIRSLQFRKQTIFGTKKINKFRYECLKCGKWWFT